LVPSTFDPFQSLDHAVASGKKSVLIGVEGAFASPFHLQAPNLGKCPVETLLDPPDVVLELPGGAEDGLPELLGGDDVGVRFRPCVT
jgi:hypothetical protein